jgi:hypothetical protein
MKKHDLEAFHERGRFRRLDGGEKKKNGVREEERRESLTNFGERKG